jgi:hypothetical protein
VVESTSSVTRSSQGSLPQGIDDLCTRIQAEFREMPGLRLTLPQAARFFGLEPARCRVVLETLVQAGQLVSDGRVFARPDYRRRSL